MIDFKANEKKYALVLILILVFTGVLYFHRLGQESLSTDEYFSLYVARQSLANIICNYRTVSNPNTIPPLYAIILHYWLNLFGQSEFAQRSLSASLGVLSVYFLFRLSCLLFDIRTGMFSALLGCLSYSWFSLFRQNRCYGLFILLVLFSFYFFFKLVKRKDAGGSFVPLAITNTLLVYTHYFSFLVILLEVIFGIYEWRKNKNYLKNIVLMCIFVGLAYLPWYSNLFYDLSREPTIIDKAPLVSTPRLIFDVLRLMFSDFHFIWSPLLAILYLPFIIRGIVRAKRDNAAGSNHIFLYMVLIFAIPFVFLYGFIYTDRMRYYAPFMFPILIFLAYGFLDLNTRGIARKTFLFAVCFFIVINNFMDFGDFYNIPADEEWKQAAALIKKIPDYRNKSNVFIFQTTYNPPVFSYYYWNPNVASSFIKDVGQKNNYAKNLSKIGAKEQVFVITDMKGKIFFDQLAELPEDAWIWIFRYHDLFFHKDFKTENQGRYFFHQIKLNRELTPIDLFLLKKVHSNS